MQLVGSARGMQVARRSPCSTMHQTSRRQGWQLAATPASRYAKAARKYDTGSSSPGLIYTRPDLANLLDLEITEAVKAHSSRAAQDPQMYAHRLAMQQQQQQESERVNWNDIL